MRIAYYTNCYKPRINGVVRAISTLKEALENQGHDVFLFAPAAPGYQDREPNVYRCTALPVEGTVVYRWAIPFTCHLRKVAEELCPDVVHVHHSVLMGAEGARLARRCGIPLVSTLHSQYWRYCPRLPVGKRVVRSIATRVILNFMRRCQRTVVPTEDLRQHIVNDAPDLEARLVLLPNPLPVERFTNVDPDPIRATFGLDQAFTFTVATRLAPEKGLFDLIEAFAIVAGRRPKVRLLILGDGPVREDLEARATELSLGHSVIFAGMIPAEEMPAHLAAADAFAYASQVDVQPLVLTEAMASQLPIVAYDAPYIRESVVDGQNGLLSEPNAGALAERMQALVDSRELCEQLANNGQRMVTHYDAAHVASQLARIYENAISRHESPV